MSTNRMLRVNELIRRELGQLCEREVVPQLSGLLTITDVKTAPDLRNAIVFYSIYGGDSQPHDAERVLRRKRAVLQRELAHRVKLKYTPVLDFRLDPTAAKADRVLELLEGLDLPEGDPEDREEDHNPGADVT